MQFSILYTLSSKAHAALGVLLHSKHALNAYFIGIPPTVCENQLTMDIMSIRQVIVLTKESKEVWYRTSFGIKYKNEFLSKIKDE